MDLPRRSRAANMSLDGALIAVSNADWGYDIYLVWTGEPLYALDRDIVRTIPTPSIWVHRGLALLGSSTAGQLIIWNLADIVSDGRVSGGNNGAEKRIMSRLPIPLQAVVVAIDVSHIWCFWVTMSLTRFIGLFQPRAGWVLHCSRIHGWQYSHLCIVEGRRTRLVILSSMALFLMSSALDRHLINAPMPMLFKSTQRWGCAIQNRYLLWCVLLASLICLAYMW